MRTAMGVVGLATLLSGCGPAYVTQPWTKPGLTRADWRADSFECWRKAELLPPAPVAHMPMSGQDARALSSEEDRRKRVAFEACLTAKGYTKAPQPPARAAMPEWNGEGPQQQ